MKNYLTDRVSDNLLKTKVFTMKKIFYRMTAIEIILRGNSMSTDRAARKIPAPLLRFKATADLIGRTAGGKTEVVLHDLADPLHSVVYVVNGTVTDRHVGQGLRHLVTEMLTAQARGTDLLPAWWYRYQTKFIRCTTQLLRDETGKLVGALCVNEDVTAELAEFNVLKAKLPGLKTVEIPVPVENGILWAEEKISSDDGKPTAVRENVRETVFKLITALAKEEGFAEREVSREERRRFVEMLNDREVFLVKGSVEYAADVIGVSKVTIYSDLDAVRRKQAGADK